MKIEQEAKLTFGHKTSARSLRRFLESVPDEAVIDVFNDPGDRTFDSGTSRITATWIAELDLSEPEWMNPINQMRQENQ